MSKKLYICHTLYHLTISLCKITKINNSVDIILFDTIENRDQVIDKLKNSFKISAIKSYSIRDTFFDISNNYYDDIYIYNDWSNIGKYLNKNKICYHLIEESYNYHQFPLLKLYFSKLPQKLSYILKGIPYPFGYSRFAIDIEVNNLSKVHQDCRIEKMIEVNRKTLFNDLKNDDVLKLLHVFNVEKIDVAQKSMLLLTQPLFFDRFDPNIHSLDDQLSYYNSIIKKYQNEYKIYVKIHPRDNCDYSSIKNITILSKQIPIEVYSFLGNFNFDLGITHSSTAIEFLDCIKEKIILKKLK